MTGALDAMRVQAAFCTLAVGSFLFVYQPMLRRLDAEIKSTRALLTLLPDDVVNAVKEIKDGIQELVKTMMH